MSPQWKTSCLCSMGAPGSYQRSPPEHQPANLPHPGGSRARGKAEAERRATVCRVDSVKFREGFPFALAEEKSSLFPSASRHASPTAQGTGLPSLLRPPHCDLQSSVKSAMQSGPGRVCHKPVSPPVHAQSSLPDQPSGPSQ